MKVRTALISSALLLAVLGWACDQGPTSPSALGAPGGASLGAAGGVSIGADGLPILTAKDKGCPESQHPSCKPDEEGDLQRFNVAVTGPHISSATQTTNGPKGGLLVKNFMLDFGTVSTGFFTGGKLTCDITGLQTGDLQTFEGTGGDHAHIRFGLFRYNGIKQLLVMDGTITAPGNLDSVRENPLTDGIWLVDAEGRGHQNGCIGEGGGQNDGTGIVFTATFVPCGGTGQAACVGA